MRLSSSTVVTKAFATNDMRTGEVAKCPLKAGVSHTNITVDTIIPGAERPSKSQRCPSFTKLTPVRVISVPPLEDPLFGNIEISRPGEIYSNAVSSESNTTL